MSFTTFAVQLIEFQKSNFASANSLRESLFAAAQNFFELNATACRSVLQHAAQTSRNLSGSLSAQDAFALSLGLAAPALEEVAGYSRCVHDIASGTGAEVLQIAETQVAHINRHITECSEIADPDSPFGSTAAAWMIRGVVTGTQWLLEAGLKSARQSAGWVNAYLAALVGNSSSVACESPRAEQTSSWGAGMTG